MASPKEIRIAQLIDSLEAGGAERMAVNYANALQATTGFSALVTTRAEGNLKAEVSPEVAYVYLHRQRVLDVKAYRLLCNFIKKHRITHVHAHSSSVFFAILLRLRFPTLTIVWHDHYGWSEQLQRRPKFALQLASLFTKGIITVNHALQSWSQTHLFCKRVLYLPNFVGIHSATSLPAISLHGEEGKRIVCLANLRPQKNHSMLLEVAQQLKATHPDWTFHLVGKDFQDAYSGQLRATLFQMKLESHVFIYGTQQEISGILKQCSIGVLTSDSEGLPVSILEYGLAGLAVIATQVGEVGQVLTEQNGILVPKGDSVSFFHHLSQLINNVSLRQEYGEALQKHIKQTYSAAAVIPEYLKWMYED